MTGFLGSVHFHIIQKRSQGEAQVGAEQNSAALLRKECIHVDCAGSVGTQQKCQGFSVFTRIYFQGKRGRIKHVGGLVFARFKFINYNPVQFNAAQNPLK